MFTTRWCLLVRDASSSVAVTHIRLTGNPMSVTKKLIAAYDSV